MKIEEYMHHFLSLSITKDNKDIHKQLHKDRVVFSPGNLTACEERTKLSIPAPHISPFMLLRSNS